jgi:hypothetical protein
VWGSPAQAAGRGGARALGAGGGGRGRGRSRGNARPRRPEPAQARGLCWPDLRGGLSPWWGFARESWREGEPAAVAACRALRGRDVRGGGARRAQVRIRARSARGRVDPGFRTAASGGSSARGQPQSRPDPPSALRGQGKNPLDWRRISSFSSPRL